MTRARNVADIIKQPFTTTLGTSNYRAGVNAGIAIASGGNYNVVIGDEAGNDLTTGDLNTGIGYAAVEKLTIGVRNTGLGAGALGTEVAGNYSTGVGQGALSTQASATSTDIYNTAVGYNAGTAVTAGVKNTLIGALAGDAITDADLNVAIGVEALTTNVLGSKSTAIGTGALAVQNPSSAADMGNTAVGFDAGVAVTTGINNTLIGALAGDNITTGDSNIIIGKGIDAASATADNQINIGGQIISDNVKVTIPKVFRAGDATASALTHGTADSASSFVSDLRTDSVLVLHNTDGSYASLVQRNSTVRAGNSAFSMLTTTTGNLGDDQHRLRGDGQTLADGAYSSGGADYAEYFEWADGNSDNEDRRGCSVVLSGSKMRIATSDDSASNIIGVISSNASVIGDGDMSRWKNKYLRDDFGGYDLDSNGDQKPNPNYNPDLAYVSRELRLEWETVGLMGKLRIKKGQPIGTNWIKMRDVSDQVEEWLVR